MEASPNAVVGAVVEAVCILLKESPDWSAAKELFGGGEGVMLVDLILGYDKQRIDHKTIKLLAKYVDDPQLRCVCVHVHQIEVDFESDLGA